MPSRRAILLGLGGLGASALAWRGYDRGAWGGRTAAAYAPWDEDLAQGALAPLRAAILAASPHNTQPWVLAPHDGGVELFADRARHLGPLDPYRREMSIGLGCALETMIIAATSQGLGADVQVDPDHLELDQPGTESRIAQITWTRADRVDPLAPWIAKRHTHRGAYEPTRKIEAALIQAWADAFAAAGARLVWLNRGEASRADLDKLIVEATQAIIADPAISASSDAWFRQPGDALLRHRDGLTLDAQALSPAMLVLAKMAPPLSADSANSFWLDATRNVHLASAPHVGVVLVDDPLDRAGAVAVGRAWARVHLSATQAGVAMHPLNQIPEIIDAERARGRPARMAQALAKILDEPRLATFAFRAGYPQSPAARSPRRPLDWVMRAHA